MFSIVNLVDALVSRAAISDSQFEHTLVGQLMVQSPAIYFASEDEH